MRKRLLAVSLLSSVVWADPPAPAPADLPSAFPVTQASTMPASVALTGETASAPVPRGMTDSTKEAVFVTLTRSLRDIHELPSSVQVITNAEIRRLRVQTAGEAITLLTSVRINHEGQLGSPQMASLRGAAPAQTLILLDGRPWGGVSFNDSQDLSEIFVEQIDRIEIVRSDMSVLYGPRASGGVINIISSRASYEGLPISHVGVEGRSFNGQTYRIDAGSRYGPVDFFFFANRSRESGFRMNEDAKTYNIGGNMGLAMGKAGKLLFDVTSYQAQAGIPGRLNPDLAVSNYDGNTERQTPSPVARQLTGTDALRASYMVALPADSLLTLRTFGSQRRVEFENPDLPRITARHEFNRGVEAQLTLPYGLLAGGTFLRDRLDSREETVPTNNFVQHVENWGWFLQETWAWKRLTLIPSVRFSNNSQFGSSTDPNVKLIADASTWLRFSGSTGSAFRAPTLDDVFMPFTNYGNGFSYQGNPALRPEKVWTTDAGFELHRDSASFKATYFRANASDQLQVTGNEAATTVNVDRARRQGYEVEAQTIFNPSFSHRLTYTYLENRGIPPGFSTPVALRLSPRHQAAYHAQFQMGKKWSMDHALRCASDYYENDNESGSKMSSTLLWDARVQFPIRQMDLYVGLNNVTDRRYRERGGYPLPGRTIYGGFDLRLWG